MPVLPPPPHAPEAGDAVGTASAEAFTRADDRQLAERAVGARAGLLGDRSVSFGVGVPAATASIVRARERQLAVVRRSTGGTGLLHEPGDIVWTVVVPRRHPTLEAGFTRAYPRLGQGVVDGLRTAGVAAAWVPAPGLAADYCTLSGLGSVLSAGDRVIGGAAQHLTATHLLHHGVISVTVDRAAVAELFGVPLGPATDRLGSLAEVAAGPLSARSVARAVRAALAADLGIPELD